VGKKNKLKNSKNKLHHNGHMEAQLRLHMPAKSLVATRVQ